MNLRHTIFTLFLFMSAGAHAFELIMIQAISDTKKTFITRNGKRQGHIPGITGTFTAEDISVLARAVTVTGQYTQWELLNTEAIIPFEKGSIVTYYPATEYIWALSPESERKKYIKSHIPQLRESMVFKGALTRAVAESVSETVATQTTRGGYLGEIYYEADIYYGLAWDIGFRYEKETVNYTTSSYVTQRSMVIADILYYFDGLRDYLKGKVFVGLGLGYGLSKTETVGLTQTGMVGLLPTAKVGLTLPFNEEWEFVVDGAFESFQTLEGRKGGRDQSTTQTNFKTGIGLRKFF